MELIIKLILSVCLLFVVLITFGLLNLWFEKLLFLKKNKDSNR